MTLYHTSEFWLVRLYQNVWTSLFHCRSWDSLNETLQASKIRCNCIVIHSENCVVAKFKDRSDIASFQVVKGDTYSIKKRLSKIQRIRLVPFCTPSITYSRVPTSKSNNIPTRVPSKNSLWYGQDWPSCFKPWNSRLRYGPYSRRVQL